MQRPLFTRTVIAIVAAQMLLSACSAVAGPQSLWPGPAPSDSALQQQRIVRTVPNFRAPSATHCSRPVTTREVPGWNEARFAPARSEAFASRGDLARDALSKSAPTG